MPDKKSVVQALMQLFTQHAHLPGTKITNKGSGFTSQVVTETMNESRIHIEDATIKHAHAIGLIERTRQKLKQILKIDVADETPQWNKYVNISVMSHNTTYHQSLKCSPTEVFHGRVPYNALNPKFTNPLQARNAPVEIQKFLDSINEKYKQTQNNILEAFHDYKKDYDRKAHATPL